MFKNGFGGGWGNMSSLDAHMHALPPGTSDEHRLLAYANHFTTRSCQTKMLLGHMCVSDVDITELNAQEAIRRLHEFWFVGSTNHWNVSIQLLHKMVNSTA